MAKALITGASGFIGTHLAQALCAAGDEVRCLVRASSRTESLAPLGVELVEGDVRDAESLRRAVADRDVVYHLAGLVKALRPDEMQAVNEGGVRHAAEACAARQTPPVLIVVSSMAAVGPARAGVARTEDEPPSPVSDYGRTKRAGEAAAEALAGQIPVTIIRPALVFGEHDPNTLSIFRPIARWGVHVTPGREPHEISLIHAADLAELLIRAAMRGRRVPADGEAPPGQGEGYYFATYDQRPSYAEFGRLVGDALGRAKVRVIAQPEGVARLVAVVSEGFGKVRRRAGILNRDKIGEAYAGAWACSAERARRELDFNPSTPLADRLRQTAEWYRQAGWL